MEPQKNLCELAEDGKIIISQDIVITDCHRDGMVLGRVTGQVTAGQRRPRLALCESRSGRQRKKVGVVPWQKEASIVPW